MWTPPGTTNAAWSPRKSSTSWTVAENGRPRRRKQSLLFMPLMDCPGGKKGGGNGRCGGRGGSINGGRKLCIKLLYELRTCWTSLWELRNSSAYREPNEHLCFLSAVHPCSSVSKRTKASPVGFPKLFLTIRIPDSPLNTGTSSSKNLIYKEKKWRMNHTYRVSIDIKLLIF